MTELQQFSYYTIVYVCQMFPFSKKWQVAKDKITVV